MGMFNKMDVGGGLADFWAYIREPRPHRWAVWGVALALTWLIFTGVEKYLIPYEKPKEQIIYFENWTADRSDAEIRADWVARAKETPRRNPKKPAQNQRFAAVLAYESHRAEAAQGRPEPQGAEQPTAPPKSHNERPRR